MSDLDLLDRKRLRELLTATGSDAQAVVLIGSYARGTAVRSVSDLDVLVISDDPPEPDSEAHVVVIPPDRFESRVHDGDDFAQWALRYGVAISGREWWDMARRMLYAAPWPHSGNKYRLAEKRLSVVDDLLAMGDDDSSQYELRLALSLVARGLLLDARVYPLSRPELPEQLESIGHGRLASMLREVSSESPLPRANLTDAVRYGRQTVAAIHVAAGETTRAESGGST
ncbi:MAG: nucleotidyltransferase domain-containing protein [Actinobacteria bacterium]|nr:nucleotidyltransferase domain-containing protein [Actinomycetota bacterium]